MLLADIRFYTCDRDIVLRIWLCNMDERNLNPILLGFANSMIWAGILPLALDGLGRFTKLGSSIMIMGLCGNAIVLLFYGYFADLDNLKIAYWILLPCFGYLIFYAFYGYRIRRWALGTVFYQ